MAIGGVLGLGACGPSPGEGVATDHAAVTSTPPTTVVEAPDRAPDTEPSPTDAVREPADRTPDPTDGVEAVAGPAVGSVSTAPPVEDASGATLGDRDVATSSVLDRPIERIVVVGDSVVFDARDRPGGRPNDIVPLIEARLAGEPDLAHVDVENLALPGLATKYAINDKIDPTRDTLGEYLPMVFDAEADGSTLLIVAVSSIDLNVMEAQPVDDLVVDLVGELSRLHDLAAVHDMPVAFVPVFGVHDSMYDDVRNGLSADRPEHHLGARVERLNEELRASGLPMLVTGFAGLDSDGVNGADAKFFVDYDAVLGNWPDDGVHPNHLGEALYADVVGTALIELLRSAPATDGS